MVKLVDTGDLKSPALTRGVRVRVSVPAHNKFQGNNMKPQFNLPVIIFGVGLILLVLGHPVLGILGLAIGGYMGWRTWEES